ncbi:hypothetical protein [Streptomyces californicus]|uniref:hypothetical protein n=1 Tax=Streptomyces californicus TaxID=67351 RepID=UPI0034087132
MHHGVAADLVDPWLSSDGDAHAVGRRTRAQEALTRQEIDDKGGFGNISGKQLAVTDRPRRTERQTRLKKPLVVKAVERQKGMISPWSST